MKLHPLYNITVNIIIMYKQYLYCQLKQTPKEISVLNLLKKNFTEEKIMKILKTIKQNDRKRKTDQKYQKDWKTGL